jgi:hypothetical protein
MSGVHANGEFKTFQTGSSFNNVVNAAAENANELDPNDIRNFSNIYDQILNSYSSTYDSIGTRLSDEAKNGFFGGVNMIGWRHANDFSNFKVTFNRSIAPSLFREDKHIVTDEIMIEIDASKFLKKLANEDVINISEQNLAAFAGLAFRRTMRYNHFADTVEDGLQTNFDKLFFMFKYFNGSNFHKLGEYDYLVKEDSFTVNAGAMGTMPIYTYGAIGAGVLYKYEKKSKVSIQKLGELDEKDPSEELRLTVEDQRGSTAGANVTLVADFFKLLQLTLLSYDFEYSYSKTYKTYLSLYSDDLSNSEKMSHVKRILRFRSFNNDLFADNIKSKEMRQKEIRKSRYLAFIWGGVKDSQTEYTEIVKDGKLHKFFSHNYEKLKYRENFFSKILTSILGKLIGYNQLAARTEVNSKTVEISYEADRDLIKAKQDYNIFEKNIFTMEMGSKIRVNQKTKLNAKKIESKMHSAINQRSKSYAKFKPAFDTTQVSAPAEFTSKIMMDNSNVAHFMNISASSVFSKFKSVCRGKSKGFFSKLRSLFSACRYRLYGNYNSFLKEWTTANYDGDIYKKCKKKYRWRYLFRRSKRTAMIQKCMEVSYKKKKSIKMHELPLWKFKDVANNVNNYVTYVDDLKYFFGNFSNKGSFSAMLNDQTPYKAYYSEGEDKQNIVTQFQVDNKLRSPASLK